MLGEKPSSHLSPSKWGGGDDHEIDTPDIEYCIAKQRKRTRVGQERPDGKVKEKNIFINLRLEPTVYFGYLNQYRDSSEEANSRDLRLP